MLENKNYIQIKRTVIIDIILKSSILFVFAIAFLLAFFMTKNLKIYNVLSGWSILFYSFAYILGLGHMIAISIINITLYIKAYNKQHITSARVFIIIRSITAALEFFILIYHLQWLIKSYLTDTILSSPEYINELYHIILPTFIPIFIIMLGAFIYIIRDCALLIYRIKNKQVTQIDYR